MSNYEIGVCTTICIDDGQHLDTPYYKVYLRDPCGSLWFECDFESLENAQAYIRVSEKHQDKTVMERAIMAEKGQE